MDIPAEILSKLERYCAYQERSEVEVRKKLGSLAVSATMSDEVVRVLKEDDFLNEHRFAEIFIRSKIKEQWGKLKIRQGLYAKGIPADIINEQMEQIDETAYQEMVRATIEKWKRLNAADADNKPKLIRHMLSKGFAIEEIMSILNQ